MIIQSLYPFQRALVFLWKGQETRLIFFFHDCRKSTCVRDILNALLELEEVLPLFEINKHLRKEYLRAWNMILYLMT